MKQKYALSEMFSLKTYILNHPENKISAETISLIHAQMAIVLVCGFLIGVIMP